MGEDPRDRTPPAERDLEERLAQTPIDDLGFNAALLEHRSTEDRGLKRILAAADAAATPALVAHLARVLREIAEGERRW